MLLSDIKKSLRFGLVYSLGLSLFLAALFPIWHWLENPGGLFRGAEGTHWGNIWETAISWFLPTIGYTLPLFIVGHWVFCRLLSLFRKKSVDGESQDTS